MYPNIHFRPSDQNIKFSCKKKLCKLDELKERTEHSKQEERSGWSHNGLCPLIDTHKDDEYSTY
jgi:hypothetical protein